MDNKNAKKGISFRTLLPCVIFLVMTILFVSGVSSVSAISEEKEMSSIEDAVVQSALFCYGVEGAYPQSIDYLKENYGLSYNEKKYIVEYSIVAKNLRPQVRVMALGQEDR